MMDPWSDPVAWREAMLSPLTLAQALRAARKAKVPRLVYRGVVFDLGEGEPAQAAAEEPPPVALFRTRASPKQKVVL
jgi:hypothetical protein